VIERQEGYFGPQLRGGKIFGRQGSGNVPTLSALRATVTTVDLKVRGEDGEISSSSGAAKGKGRDESSHAAQGGGAKMEMGPTTVSPYSCRTTERCGYK